MGVRSPIASLFQKRPPGATGEMSRSEPLLQRVSADLKRPGFCAPTGPAVACEFSSGPKLNVSAVNVKTGECTNEPIQTSSIVRIAAGRIRQ